MKIGRWIAIIAVIALLVGGYFFATTTTVGRSLVRRVTGNSQTSTQRFGNTASSSAASSADASTQVTTVQIQPASAVVKEVSASGHIELNSQMDVALAVDGIINQVNVNVGDVVTAGQVLVTLDTADLERTLRRSQLAVSTQLNKIDQLKQQTTAADIAVAEANLESAQANLADVKAGPSQTELSAARSSLSAAWAKYNDLVAGPSQDSLTQLGADMAKKEAALAEMQRAYDKIAWRNDLGATKEATDLQQASIDYESAKAAYAEKVQPASTADLQSAAASAQNAQKQLDDLLSQPTDSDIATAAAKVVDAQATLDNLKAGPDAFDMTDAQLALEKALVDLEEANTNLANARVLAPIAGAVLDVNAQVGQRAGRGTVVVSLADPRELKLTIDVAEVDINQINQGQPAQVAVDAFPGRSFAGSVSSISPSSSGTSGLINYPVVVRLTDSKLEGVRPGMTAVATISNTQRAAADDWLVPTNAVQQSGSDTVVTVMRNNTETPIRVIPSRIQGEWTMVKSPDLHSGDQVVGSVTTKIDANSQFRFGPGGGGPPGGGGGNRPAP